MHESLQTAKKWLRGGAACLLALLLCAAAPARAADVTADGPAAGTSARMLVPVGHTVGIKLFARGVLVVKLPEGDSPARESGLQTGDIIVKCGGVSVTSTEQFQTLLQNTGETLPTRAAVPETPQQPGRCPARMPDPRKGIPVGVGKEEIHPGRGRGPY